MANFNRVVLMGNLTRDPKLSYLPSNTPVVEIGLAVNRKFKRQDGQQKEETLFIDCNAFGRTAEVINQYLKKGRPILIEGRLKLDRWNDKEGNPRSKHNVVIENFQFVDSRGGDGGGSGGGGGDSDHYESTSPAPAGNEDDIPF
ncbi:MAG: single-stranded DNA-binding protein [Phycisphaeraceae bacterium]|nr:single-stranded DNA-binding protein [Phycisphaeraceae bacterium]